MNEIQILKDSMKSVLRELECQKYSNSALGSYSAIYSDILKHMQTNNISSFNEKACIEYVFFKTGYRLDGFYGAGNRKINTVTKPLQILLDYIQTKTVKFKMRPRICPYCCPAQFEEEYSTFQEELIYRGYARATIKCNIEKVNKFLTFLDTCNVNCSKSINVKHLTTFLWRYSNCKPKYISTIIYVLRNYLNFLYGHGFMDEDISKSLPKVRIIRNAFIPYCWKRRDVSKLLEAVDRGDKKGKRDYAILLLVVRLGLRVSDIRGLKFHNLNWSSKTISLTMQKTKQPHKLPLLDDIGWAIIDYLKNGRPETKCDAVFVRHRAPYDSFGENECFQRELHRYMIKAGLEIPLDVHCGLHSLRSTLARNMLEAEAPLPVISEVLGHQSINTTSIYLKIDLDGLKKCALDPEEVFGS
ncbi:MAG: tyrosine-type recombinase/integrase [Actinobacteria bacterium]|nr:tyrosine-type recombinase/integrase [Actinomycetota bacterium]